MSITQGLYQFNGNLYAAWKGEVGDDRLFYASFNGTKWQSENVHIPGNSSVGPSLASPNKTALYAAWKGENGDSDQRLFYSSYNGSVWAAQIQIPGVASSVGPSLGVFNGVLYAAWKGEEGDNQIYWSYLDGSIWQPQQKIPGASSLIGPSLAEYNGQLFAGWVGLNEPTLQFLEFNGSSWQAAPVIPGNPGSSIGVSLAPLGNSLYAAWKGEGTDEGIYYAVLTNGTWTGQTQIPNVGSSIGPALAAYGSNIYAMWKGEGNDQSLYYAKLNGSWSTQKTLPGNTGQDSVIAPGGGLASSSNYLIGSGNCANLLNPSVTIQITEDLVVAPGVPNFGFQMNCYSPKHAKVAWQQYLIVPHLDSETVSCGYQGYLDGAGQLMNGASTISLATPNGSIIPANWVFVFSLKCDPNGNIYEANFSASDPKANPPWSTPYPLDLYNLTLNSGGPVTIADLAPIVAFQLNIVGPAGSSSTAVFTSGAGIITYAADNPLTAFPVMPACAEITNPTAEVSNSYYTTVPAGASGTLVQNFGVTQG
jgi:hypothetical protein